MADTYVVLDESDSGPKKTSVSQSGDDDFAVLDADAGDDDDIAPVSGGPELVYEALLGGAAAAYILALIITLYRLYSYSDPDRFLKPF